MVVGYVLYFGGVIRVIKSLVVIGLLFMVLIIMEIIFRVRRGHDEEILRNN